jgi:hypothetical protein
VVPSHQRKPNSTALIGRWERYAGEARTASGIGSNMMIVSELDTTDIIRAPASPKTLVLRFSSSLKEALLSRENCNRRQSHARSLRSLEDATRPPTGP